MMPLQPIPPTPTSGATQEEWGMYNALVLMHRQVEREDTEDNARKDQRKAVQDIEQQKVALMKAELIVNAAIALLVDRTTTTSSAATLAAEVAKCVGLAKAVLDTVTVTVALAPVVEPFPAPAPAPAPTPAPSPGGLTG